MPLRHLITLIINVHPPPRTSGQAHIDTISIKSDPPPWLEDQTKGGLTFSAISLRPFRDGLIISRPVHEIHPTAARSHGPLVVPSTRTDPALRAGPARGRTDLLSTMS